MMACGLCVLALVGVIVYELITKSGLSWHAFGFKFFFQSEWDPVNDQYGALPFVYGTIVSSILGFDDCRAVGGRRGGVHHRDGAALACVVRWLSPPNCWPRFPA